MLSGQCPDKHNVNWNDYMPELGYAQVTDLFDIAHAAGMQTAPRAECVRLQKGGHIALFTEIDTIRSHAARFVSSL